MGLEWSMVDEFVEDEEEIERWLQLNYEPFAVSNRHIYFKKQIVTERDEPKSSTRPENENAAGNERDAADT